jgi:predicted  nucleic acid-binding Zn-ribbon protein
MDIARLEELESHIIRLVEAHVRMKEENAQLCQKVQEHQRLLEMQEEELARLRPEQEELTALRQVMQTMQRERSAIRHKLEQMLVTIEWLEARTEGERGAKT